MDFESFVLVAATADLEEERAAREYADAIEFRMDLAEHPVEALETYDGELPLIATNRPTWEGGGVGEREDENETTRLDALETAIDAPRVEAIDIELRAIENGKDGNGAPGGAEELLEAARAVGIETIVSTHDFEAAPERSEMVDRLERACEYGTVGKLAVTAGESGDVLDLLVATRELTRAGRRVATMAMGAPGRHSRAVAPLYGSKIGYAPVDPEKATAPGQYDLETLATLLAQLR